MKIIYYDPILKSKREADLAEEEIAVFISSVDDVKKKVAKNEEQSQS